MDTGKLRDVHVRVASQVLCTVSPVFNAMFSPSSVYSESISIRRAAINPTRPAIRRLEEDDADAAVEVLRALHHKYSQSIFSCRVSIDLLLRIAKFADKYQLAEALELKAKEWFESHSWRESYYISASTPPPGQEDALAISWVFLRNNGAQFKALTGELSLRARMSDITGRLLFGSGYPQRRLAEFLPDILESTP